MRRLEQLTVFIWFWKRFFSSEFSFKKRNAIQSNPDIIKMYYIWLLTFLPANCENNNSKCAESVMQQVHEILWIHQQHLVAGKWWWGVFGQLLLGCTERAAPKLWLLWLLAGKSEKASLFPVWAAVFMEANAKYGFLLATRTTRRRFLVP